MRRGIAAAACCYLALAPVAATAEPSPADLGRQALESRCGRCHAIGADGASAHAEAPAFREIVKRYAPEDLEESLAEGITSGHPDMPEFVLSPEEIGAVVAYLHTLEGK
jgi:cytochrome c